MRIKLLILSLIILLSTAVSAKIIISSPNRIELGSSHKVSLSYENDRGKMVELSELEISLSYDKELIDQIISITGRGNDFKIKSADFFTPGSIIISFIPKNGETVKLDHGVSVVAADIKFHINQKSKKKDYSTKLFTLSSDGSAVKEVTVRELFVRESVISAVAEKPVRQPLLSISDTYIENSRAPESKGIVRIDPVNIAGRATEYHIQMAKPFDRTPPVFTRIYRREEGGHPYIIGDRIFSDKFVDRNVNQGTLYEYILESSDSTTPGPNKRQLAPFKYRPIDVTPTENVKNLKAERLANGNVRLTWENPLDADLAGVLILINYDSPGMANLVGAKASHPYSDGEQYLQWQEPEDPPPAKGWVRYFSEAVYDPKDVPQEYIDDYIWPGYRYYYRVHTYDLASDWPRKMGRNYSSGVDKDIFIHFIESAPGFIEPEINIWFDNKLYQTIGSQDFFVDKQPKLKVEIKIKDPQDYTYSFSIDGSAYNTFPVVSYDGDNAILEANIPAPFTVGRHDILVQATKSIVAAAGGFPVATKTATVVVRGGPLRIEGIPLGHPSPWNPRKGPVTFQYTLSKSSGIDLYIIDTTATIRAKMSFNAGEPGGQAGLNKILYKGDTLDGMNITEGIYYINIVSREDNLSKGKLKLTVFRGQLRPKLIR